MERIILINLLFISALMVSCKKPSKKLTTVNFEVTNPATKTGFEGVKVQVIQQKSDIDFLQDNSENTVVCEGYTDVNGKVSLLFNAYNSASYYYWPVIDNSFTAGGIKFLEQPDFNVPLKKDEVNQVLYKGVELISFVLWVKNINCFDSDDRMRYRLKSTIDKFDNWSPWRPWPLTGDYYYGCYNSIGNVHSNVYQDITVFEFEVIRNGITELRLDTIATTGVNGVDTIKLFY